MATGFEMRSADIFITEGSEGIGHGLAARFLAAGSTVLITGRSPQKLESARRGQPGLPTGRQGHLRCSISRTVRVTLSYSLNLHRLRPASPKISTYARIERHRAMGVQLSGYVERHTPHSVLG